MQKQHLLGPMTWKVTQRNVWNLRKTTQQLYKVATPCIDDHQFKEENESVGELSAVCSQIVMKCLYLARIGRHDIVRSVTSCDERLAHLISYIHHTTTMQTWIVSRLRFCRRP